ncbi:hypothetical protein [Alkalilimnicola ehrlichii]|uniref:hypothetical protein n=1 Tax=Alkalilimnicola ehrlichii TaxID=351052 RepID=UPI003B9F3268
MTNIVEAFTDPQLLGQSFGEDTREAWRAVLSGAFALPMDNDRLSLFKRLSGDREPPQRQARELWAIAGRRSDKTHTAAGIAVYLATIGAELDGTLARLTAGERGVVQLLAVDRQQAKVALGYVRGLFADSPVMSSLVEKENTEGVLLRNGVSIEVATNSHRAVRGRTLLAAILDECAFFKDEATATPDVEVYRALVPSLATTGGMLIGISSPYARRGLLYSKWRKHYGKPGDVLVVQGGTLDFNPTLDPRVIAEAEQDDPEAAKAEWHGQFRADVEGFVTREAVDACTAPGRIELPPVTGERYTAFVDPSGGSKDAFTLAIAHQSDGVAVVDAIRAQKPPFSPEAVVKEFAGLLKEYRISKVVGDRYGGEFPRELFRKQGIAYKLSDRPKSDLYRDMLPLLNSGRVELLDNGRLQNELTSLERRTSRAGKDSIDHPPNGTDDVVNSVAGCIIEAAKPKAVPRVRRMGDSISSGSNSGSSVLDRIAQGQKASGRLASTRRSFLRDVDGFG